MSNILIIFGSTTGNTEFTAETIRDYLEDKSHEVNFLNVSDTNTSELGNSYDLYLLGCSTWGTDEIELQEDFVDFFDDMKDGPSLTGKSFAVFGCGDSSYEYFCGAVDVIEERSEKMGARIVTDSLRIDGEPEESEINEWIEGVINAL